jgi:hypothetical protein
MGVAGDPAQETNSVSVILVSQAQETRKIIMAPQVELPNRSGGRTDPPIGSPSEISDPSPSVDDAKAQTIDPPPLPARRVRLPTPPGYRVLHVLVPERVFNHAKAQAYLSNLKFPDYITRLLQSAGPIVRP